MPNQIIIDVRERDEYAKEYVEGSINIPLSQLQQIASLSSLLADKTILLMCQSGKRASMAKDRLSGESISCEVIAGGMSAWKAEGKPVFSVKRRVTISIFRQVQIIVGGLVALFSFLAYGVSVQFSLVAGVLGTTLCVAGIFGFCMLAEVLAKMPWNKTL
ncbi:MAG: DUF2892 domain-containing protein [Candidatus Margulisbacteria bacterium]|nr:DUF2892 domain-containing protein [Candidatus Margulisiibacteriota bacterium]